MKDQRQELIQKIKDLANTLRATYRSMTAICGRIKTAMKGVLISLEPGQAAGQLVAVFAFGGEAAIVDVGFAL